MHYTLRTSSCVTLLYFNSCSDGTARTH
jgi:hypothetical protein